VTALLEYLPNCSIRVYCIIEENMHGDQIETLNGLNFYTNIDTKFEHNTPGGVLHT